MVCGHCNTFFCWLCNAQLNPRDPYLHYRNPESTCFNRLNQGIIVDDDEDDDEDDDVFFHEFVIVSDSEDDPYDEIEFEEALNIDEI